ncbi:MAG: TonB-dependent receptor [Bacteroidales bacterium]|jgi:outer membrane receptor protein involved in Fe transport|nr:TonB-dependent receptor [Bacteroidales bacterium]
MSVCFKTKVFILSFLSIIVLDCFCLKGQDTIINIPQVDIISNIKTNDTLNKQPFISYSFNKRFISNNNITQAKNFSSFVPSLYIPDYGSKITSSIYLRGLGSRIDNSSVGICLDGVMLINKNCFDFDYFDISSINVIKSHTSTLFGMNTMAGVVSINTLSPMDYQGENIVVGYSNANTYNIGASIYKKNNKNFAYMIGMYYNHSDGFFENEYKKEKCDWINSLSLRSVLQWKKKNDVNIKNATYVSLLKQGGYPYCLYDTTNKTTKNVSYNDESGYKRMNIINNFDVSYKNDNLSFQSQSSLQMNYDKMNLDQDFTNLSYFNMYQKEEDYAFSQEFILKNNKKKSRFDWIVGTYAYYRYLKMNTPVTFLKDGIDSLILLNINNGIHNIFPDNDILFSNDTMPINSKFTYPRMGFALYGEASYKIKHWKIVIGMRVDNEKIGFDYQTNATVDYLFNLTMSNYRTLTTQLNGKTSKSYMEFLPKMSVMYEIATDKNVFFTISRGYLTGGYNTQMFADIMQNQMRQMMTRDLGIAMSDAYSNYKINDIINYSPQYVWNYEIGTHLSFLNKKLNLNMALYYLSCKDQQITIFLTQTTTGRMMTNVASSRVIGGEMDMNYRIKNWLFSVSYGLNDARFISYDDNKQNYKNKFLQYVPFNTMNLNVDYLMKIDNKYLDNIMFSINYNGVGKIYFNQENTIKQNYYSLLNTNITFRRYPYSLTFFVRNIFSEDYYTFYFQSCGKSFVQKSKPIQIGATMKITLK